MQHAVINYGTNSRAEMWGRFTASTIEGCFMHHANQCFGIRKSIEYYTLISIKPIEGIPAPWGNLPGAHIMLKHSGGDTIVWDDKGNKVKSEWD